MPDEVPLITTELAAQMLGLSVETIKYHRKRGNLKGVKVYHRNCLKWVFDPNEILRFHRTPRIKTGRPCVHGRYSKAVKKIFTKE